MIQNPQLRNPISPNNFEIISVDLRNLIEMIPNPCVIVNVIDRQVIAANFLFSELTQIGVSEFAGVRINEIIQAIDLSTITDGVGEKVILTKKNNETQELILSPKFINRSKKFLLLKFEESENNLVENENLWEQFAKDQTGFYPNIANFSYDELLTQVLQTGRHITNSGELAFYLTNKTNSVLKRFPLNESSFPENIPYIELNRIKTIDFWEPGKRVLSEIHRAGRLNKFNSVITIPLSSEKQKFGLLIAATKSNKDLREINEILSEYAKWVTTVLQLFDQNQSKNQKLKGIDSKIDKLETAFNYSNDCQLLINEQNEILEFNEKFLDLLDYLPIEILNKRIDEIINDQHVLLLLKNQKESEEICEETLEILDRHGNKKTVVIIIFPFSKIDEKRKLIIIKDKTEMVELENEISVLQKTAVLGELFTEFAHDVRNIINRITTGLQLLVKKINPDESVLASVQDIQKECINITDLMESVLSFSRQKYENFQLVNLKTMIERIIFRIQQKAKLANVSLVFTSENDHYLIRMDQRSLERVIVNLINNGIEAIGKEGGTISVNLSFYQKKPGFILMQIADTGPGIPQEIQSNLYKKFASGKPEGTGLGLFISQKIIEEHRGSIELETFPGGTIFKIYLPVEEQGVEL